MSQEKETTEYREKKGPHDMITDGVLAYGVNLGRFVFEEEGYTVYVISDLPHIGASDVFMVYQISKADYEKLLPLSTAGKIPTPPISHSVATDCRIGFLCGESAYCYRYYCTLKDVNMSHAEKISAVPVSSEETQPEVMNYCPTCGKKNNGKNYCADCGTKLAGD